MFHKIMLAWDGSDNAVAAYRVAQDLASRYRARLVAVSITHIPEHAERPGDKERALEEARSFYSGKLNSLVRGPRSPDIVVEHKVVPGDRPAETLIEYARRESFDIIVIGRKRVERPPFFMIRGVTDRVVRNAPCPVLVAGRGE
ncbi:universal stress protein [Rubrobacter naiadicus]|uniref:universal stress protein n=1 Tax=Rubrobacter naiadicus TaxID=1392641 RepID=UPI00236117F5|nr:universal stress protein [Rubrobacter naiadicus]